jgi:predicted DsbA family dithiol-disulfide isomerase
MPNMIHDRAKAIVVATFALSFWGVASAPCQDSEKAQSSKSSQVSSQQADSPVVAYIGNTVIRQDDVDRYAGHEIDELTKRLYLLRSQALNSMIDSMVVREEAARQHEDVEHLLQTAVKPPNPPSSEEVEREWSNNYDSLRSLGEVSGHYQVVLNIESHDQAGELRKYLDQLRERDQVSILLKPPVTKLEGRPGSNLLGNLNGTTELVVFQDYECPFCRQFAPELKSAIEKDAALSDLKVTIKQFPLPQHKGAFDAAVAVECAGEQNRFQAMHELLIANQDHSLDGLTKTATQAGLDLAKFNGCMNGDGARVQVRLDMEEARKNGVEGTPSLFLEGQAVDLPNDPKDLFKVLEAKMKPRPETSASNPATPASSTR